MIRSILYIVNVIGALAGLVAGASLVAVPLLAVSCDGNAWMFGVITLVASCAIALLVALILDQCPLQWDEAELEAKLREMAG